MHAFSRVCSLEFRRHSWHRFVYPSNEFASLTQSATRAIPFLGSCVTGDRTQFGWCNELVLVDRAACVRAGVESMMAWTFRGRGGRWAAIVACVTIMVGVLVAGGGSPAFAIPPLPAPPAQLAKDAQVVLKQFGGETRNTFTARVVAPGIAVYSGWVGDRLIPNRTRPLPHGQNPSNPDFLQRVQLMIDEIGRWGPGRTVLDALARLRPSASSDSGRWGVRGSTWDDPSGNPTSINVVIGIAASPGTAAFTSAARADQDSNGRGTASLILLDPTFPVNWQWSAGEVPYVTDPTTILFHELVHAMRSVMGAADPTMVHEAVVHVTSDGRTTRESERIQMDELRTVGNPFTLVWDGNNAAAQYQRQWRPMGADTRVSDSVIVASGHEQLYAASGYDVSAQQLREIVLARQSVQRAYTDVRVSPTEYAFARARQQIPRSHYSVEGLPEETFRINGDPQEWMDHQTHLTDSARQAPAEQPHFFTRDPYPFSWASCEDMWQASCKAKVRFEKYESFQLMSQRASPRESLCVQYNDKDLVPTWSPYSRIELSVEPCLTVSNIKQTLAYSQSTQQVLINSVGTTPVQLCLTAPSDTYNTLLKAQPCSTGPDPKQRWEYTTLGQWRLVVDTSINQFYRCVTADPRYGVVEALKLGSCHEPAWSRWNIRRPDVQLEEFKFVSPATGRIFTPNEVDATFEYTSSRDQLLRFYRVKNGSGLLETVGRASDLCLEADWRTGPPVYPTHWLSCDNTDLHWKIEQGADGLSTISTLGFFTSQSAGTPGRHFGPVCLMTPTNVSGRPDTWQECGKGTGYERWRVVPTWAVPARTPGDVPWW